MHTATDALELRAQLAQWRKQDARIAFVPTMGNLHDGHFSLITLARARADRVVASIFVNPTQFGPREDYANYPRTLAQDQAGLIAHACDLLFVPSVEEIYPYGTTKTVRVEVPGMSDVLDGASRPGHFVGVATVVTKLFNLVQPDIAVFGQKDYQQLLIIRRLVSDLVLPIEIVAGQTLREANGLAMSSRNQYLTHEERERAGIVYRTLCSMIEGIRVGQARFAIEAQGLQALHHAGLQPEYVVLRRAKDLSEPDAEQRAGLVALIAARLGQARLIDNLLMGQ